MSSSRFAYFWPPRMPDILDVELTVQRMRWTVALCVLRGPYNVREIAERVGKSLRYIRSRLNSEDMTVSDAALIAFGADRYLTFRVREPQP
jgi:hypothetical protein